MPDIILPIADTHIGSKLGLLHPKTPGVKQNRWQSYTWRCWKHMLDRLPKRLAAVVFMDEMMDGPTDKNHKYGTCITRPRDQRAAAYMVLEELAARADEKWFIIGSAWHVGEFGEETIKLAEDLGAQVWSDGDAAGHNLLWKRGGVVLDFAHPRSVVEVNRSMPLEREMRYRRADDPLPKKLRGKAQVSCIVRAHSHQFGVWRDRHGLSVGVPSWQGLYFGYGTAKRSPARMFTDVGWLTLAVDAEADHPVGIADWCLYDLPKVDVWDSEGERWISQKLTLP